MRALLAFAAGLLFALGLGLSQMTQPEVVLGFLDLANFNPTLIFVMIGAVATHALPTWWALRRGRPLLDDELHLPTATALDAPLIGGAVLFGIGWGLAGYCPGPALVSAASGSEQALLLVGSMFVGMASVQGVRRWSPAARRVKKAHAAHPSTDGALRGL